LKKITSIQKTRHECENSNSQSDRRIKKEDILLSKMEPKWRFHSDLSINSMRLMFRTFESSGDKGMD
jgi:hypothetical protein